MTNVRRRLFPVGIMLAVALFSAAHADDDPPGRVVRLNLVDGQVTMAPAGSDEWTYATVNRPLTTGDRLWVDRNTRAELHTGGTALRLAAETSLDFLTVDDDTLQLRMTQGTLAMRVRTLWDGQTTEVDTPNLAIVMHEPGDIRVDVAPDSGSTIVSVRGGEVEAVGSDGSSITLSNGETIRFTGTRLAEDDASDERYRDSFDDWVAVRMHREDRAASVHYVSRDVIGYEDLDDYGRWRVISGYGPVWIPSVVAHDWAPYRYGHWVWVAPWGWSWVDDAPWGFAPFHYGRWAWLDRQWCWVPGEMGRRPVYAPALVAFATGGGGVRWGVSLSLGVPGVAWFPLGPGEAYRPGYRASAGYFNQINHTTINQTVINNIYINQHAPGGISAMPGSNFAQGQPVQNSLTLVTPTMLHAVQTVGTPPIAPTQQGVLGGRMAGGAPVPPGATAPVVASRAPIVPPAMRDHLLRQYSEQGGNVGGPPAQPARRPIGGTTFVPGVRVAPAPVDAPPPAHSSSAPIAAPQAPSEPTPWRREDARRNGNGSDTAPGSQTNRAPVWEGSRTDAGPSRPGIGQAPQPAVPRPPVLPAPEISAPVAAEPRLPANSHREVLREDRRTNRIERQPVPMPEAPRPTVRLPEPMPVAPRQPVQAQAPHVEPVHAVPRPEPARPEPPREKEGPGKPRNDRRDPRENRE